MINYSIAPASLHRLRRRLLAAGAGTAADIMQEAGFATGEGLLAAWRRHVADRTTLNDPSQLDARWFAPLLQELCAHLGWGDLAMHAIAERALLFTSNDWAEAEPGGAEQPGCYFTCGCLAAFLSAQSHGTIAVLEVECRSSGSARCCFLAGSSATLAAVYDLVTAGGNWRDAFAAHELPA